VASDEGEEREKECGKIAYELDKIDP